jgi:hypothetical protein
MFTHVVSLERRLAERQPPGPLLGPTPLHAHAVALTHAEHLRLAIAIGDEAAARGHHRPA